MIRYHGYSSLIHLLCTFSFCLDGSDFSANKELMLVVNDGEKLLKKDNVRTDILMEIGENLGGEEHMKSFGKT